MKRLLLIVGMLAYTVTSAYAKRGYEIETWSYTAAPKPPTVIVQTASPAARATSEYHIKRDLADKPIMRLEEGPNSVTSSVDYNNLGEHVVEIEEQLKALTTRAHGAAERDKAYEARIAELERIVRGLQKQVTILHAKKANK